MRVFILSLLVASALATPIVESDKPQKSSRSSLNFDRYWPLEEVYDYMLELELLYPELTEIEIMGATLNGRQIRGLRITNEALLPERQPPIIFVTAGKVARDWITVMVAINLMHELVDKYDEHRNIVDNVEWFIIPVANPDGYEFTWSSAANRNWIKNRRVNADSDCIGVHVERNFVFNWGLGPWSSPDPCANDFRGPYGDSEEETKTIQFANDIFRLWSQSYISIKGGTATAHSTVTWPFSSNNELFRPHFRDQIGVANLMTDTIWRQTGARYRTSSEGNAVGLISGTSGDYASGRDNIPYTYTIYTPRAATGNAWMVPISEINRIVAEIFAGVAALGNVIADLGVPTNQ